MKRTPGVALPGFDQRGIRSGDAFTAASVYDPAQDRVTQRQGNQIHGPYGDASVSTATPPADWQQQIVQKHPDIGIAGTPANLAFVEAFKGHNDWRKASADADNIMARIAATNGAQQDAANLTRKAPGAGRNSPIGDVYADDTALSLPAPAAARNSPASLPDAQPQAQPPQYADAKWARQRRLLFGANPTPTPTPTPRPSPQSPRTILPITGPRLLPY